ncbi:MAG: VOC family protein [Mycobacterium sp.]
MLGLTIPEAESPHVEVELPGGSRLLFDTEQAIASFHSGRTSPTSPGRVVPAFGLSAPADVDAVFARVTDAGHPAVVKPFDAPWGQRNATEADPDGTSVDLYGLGSLLLRSRIGEEGQRKLASRIGLEARHVRGAEGSVGIAGC